MTLREISYDSQTGLFHSRLISIERAQESYVRNEIQLEDLEQHVEAVLKEAGLANS
jgi:hypothetical protein